MTFSDQLAELTTQYVVDVADVMNKSIGKKFNSDVITQCVVNAARITAFLFEGSHVVPEELHGKEQLVYQVLVNSILQGLTDAYDHMHEHVAALELLVACGAAELDKAMTIKRIHPKPESN